MPLQLSGRRVPWREGLFGVISAARADILFYRQDGFQGRSFVSEQTLANFADVGFNDRASSVIVRSGTWQLCTGRYASPGGMANRISSIRPVAAPGYGPEAGGWGSGARALLYEGQFLTGRSFLIDSEVIPNLASTGFNDRAVSLRIEAGYWMFCSDANFAGECNTFGPGDYGTLPAGLSNRISSGRRIRDQYPYTQSPNWQPR